MTKTLEEFNYLLLTTCARSSLCDQYFIFWLGGVFEEIG